jgi:hypothetical protein
MASIRAIGHSALAAPMATGAFEGRAWVVEPMPDTATIADRLAAGERFTAPEAIRLLREVARGLAGLHRHKLAHGMVGPDAVTMQRDTVTLHRLGSRHDGTTAADLTGLGGLGWAVLTGEEHGNAAARLRQLRPTVPEELDRVIEALLHPHPDAGPTSAAEVLAALDGLPVTVPSRLGSLMDTAGRGARVPAPRNAALLIAGVGLLAIVIWLLTR